MHTKTWGFARIEFIPLIDEIQRLADGGYSQKSIYNKLLERGCITMALVTFRKLFTKYIRINTVCCKKKQIVKATPGVKPEQTTKPKPPRTPRIIGTTEDTSFGKKQYDISELV